MSIAKDLIFEQMENDRAADLLGADLTSLDPQHRAHVLDELDRHQMVLDRHPFDAGQTDHHIHWAAMELLGYPEDARTLMDAADAAWRALGRHKRSLPPADEARGEIAGLRSAIGLLRRGRPFDLSDNAALHNPFPIRRAGVSGCAEFIALLALINAATVTATEDYWWEATERSRGRMRLVLDPAHWVDVVLPRFAALEAQWHHPFGGPRLRVLRAQQQ